MKAISSNTTSFFVNGAIGPLIIFIIFTEVLQYTKIELRIQMNTYDLIWKRLT